MGFDAGSFILGVVVGGVGVVALGISTLIRWLPTTTTQTRYARSYNVRTYKYY